MPEPTGAPGRSDDRPAALVAALGDGPWVPVPGGTSFAEVLAGRLADGRPAYLKSASGDPSDPESPAGELAAEHGRLVWLADRLPVPEVLGWWPGAAAGAPTHLLTGAVDGTPAVDPVVQQDPEALVVALAEGLRRIHAADPGAVPGRSGLEPRLARARTRVERGLVDQRDFEPAYARYRPDELLGHLEAARPTAPEDLVVVHGDPSLANVLIDGDGRGGLAVTGLVDVGRAGVADRYLDLAICARSLATHVSPEALGPFFHAYGIEAPDLRKVDFYVLLDEFN